MATHYEVLGVAPGASPDEVRRAYHERARRLHPDRLLDVTPDELARAEQRMRDVNEAWRVLRDTSARADYDRSLRAPATVRDLPDFEADEAEVANGADEEDDLVPVAPGGPMARVVAGLPWLLLIAILVSIFVFTAYAADDNGRDTTPVGSTPADAVGTCIGTMPAAVTTSVPCGQPGAREIVGVVQPGEVCPDGTSRVALLDSADDLCVRP